MCRSKPRKDTLGKMSTSERPSALVMCCFLSNAFGTTHRCKSCRRCITRSSYMELSTGCQGIYSLNFWAYAMPFGRQRFLCSSVLIPIVWPQRGRFWCIGLLGCTRLNEGLAVCDRGRRMILMRGSFDGVGFYRSAEYGAALHEVQDSKYCWVDPVFLLGT